MAGRRPGELRGRAGGRQRWNADERRGVGRWPRRDRGEIDFCLCFAERAASRARGHPARVPDAGRPQHHAQQPRDSGAAHAADARTGVEPGGQPRGHYTWDAYLAGNAGGEDVSPYVGWRRQFMGSTIPSPRATDLGVVADFSDCRPCIWLKGLQPQRRQGTSMAAKTCSSTMDVAPTHATPRGSSFPMAMLTQVALRHRMSSCTVYPGAYHGGRWVLPGFTPNAGESLWRTLRRLQPDGELPFPLPALHPLRKALAGVGRAGQERRRARIGAALREGRSDSGPVNGCSVGVIAASTIFLNRPFERHSSPTGESRLPAADCSALEGHRGCADRMPDRPAAPVSHRYPSCDRGNP